MFINELFESVIREARKDHSSQLFESVLREADENEVNQESEKKEEELIFLDDLVKMTNVLSTGKEFEVISHDSFGDIVVRLGEAKKNSEGLRHIIFRRKLQKKTDDEITAILALVGSALHDGKPIRSGRVFKIIHNYTFTYT